MSSRWPSGNALPRKVLVEHLWKSGSDPNQVMGRRKGGMMPCDRRSTNRERHRLGTKLCLHLRQCRKGAVNAESCTARAKTGLIFYL